MNFFLEANDISKSFGDLVAVDKVNIQIKPGHCFALLGPNGAGKTTTIDMLIGLKKPDSGSVVVMGQDFKKNAKKIFEQIGVVLQQTNLYKKLTVRETLSLFSSFYKDVEPIEKMLDLLELNSKADERLEKLSGGLKQRLHLACALIHKPKLLFLDEPTTGLDPQSRQLLWKLIQSLKAENGCSIILTTHYMEEAEFLADDVGIIDHGKIIEQGSPHALIQKLSFKNSMVVEVEEKVDSFEEKSFELNSKGFSEKRFDDFDDDISQLLKKVSHMKKVKNISFRQSNLEDVFMKFTGRGIRD